MLANEQPAGLTPPEGVQQDGEWTLAVLTRLTEHHLSCCIVSGHALQNVVMPACSSHAGAAHNRAKVHQQAYATTF